MLFLGKHHKGKRKRVENVKEMEERRKIKVRQIKIKRINGYIRGKNEGEEKILVYFGCGYHLRTGRGKFSDLKGQCHQIRMALK